MDTTQAIQDSVINIRQKTLPAQKVPGGLATQEHLLNVHTLYDFFGLDFASRTGREAVEDQRKIAVVEKYISENFDEPMEGLRTLDGQFGARPTDTSRLDHFYHCIKYKNEAFERLPAEEQHKEYTSRLEQTRARIEETRASIRAAMDQAKEAKELAKETERLHRMETRRAIIEARANAMLNALTPHGPTPPSTTV